MRNYKMEATIKNYDEEGNSFVMTDTARARTYVIAQRKMRHRVVAKTNCHCPIHIRLLKLTD